MMISIIFIPHITLLTSEKSLFHHLFMSPGNLPTFTSEAYPEVNPVRLGLSSVRFGMFDVSHTFIDALCYSSNGFIASLIIDWPMEKTLGYTTTLQASCMNG